MDWLNNLLSSNPKQVMLYSFIAGFGAKAFGWEFVTWLFAFVSSSF